MARADAHQHLAEPKPPLQQSMPVQEPGQRPACALPYDVDVLARVQPERGLHLLIHNRSAVGVSLNAHAADGRIDPRFYTLGAGDRLDELWPLGATSDNRYALSLHGPNGYLRTYAGSASRDAAVQLEVEASYDAASQRLLLRVSNPGRVPVPCRIVSSYDARSVLDEVPASSSWVSDWDLAGQDHWYDVSIRSPADPHFVRRLAGHVETGRASRSDPAIGGTVA
jgi:phospholipase C